MGWWFGRILTFEVVADSDSVTLSAILADASGGAIQTDAPQTVGGYAAYGKSVAASVQPLVDCFDVPLFDDGVVLRPAADQTPLQVSADELGNSADGEKVSAVQREQLPVRAIPSTLRLTYYDPDRDYQAGEARASAGDQGTNEVQLELPAALSADDAKTLVQRMLARQWAARDRLTLRLPPTRVDLEPGSIVQPQIVPGSWLVDTCTVEGFVTVATLRPSWQPAASLVGESGRIVASADIVDAPTTLALIDTANLADPQANEPAVLIAASSPNRGWAARPLVVNCSGQTFATQMPVRKSILGTATSVLADAEPYLIDQINSVDIQLVDRQQWLTSCDDDALASGANLVMLGNELVQFGSATPLGNGAFRLARLLRSRGATEWAAPAHAAGELFCLLEPTSVRPLSLPIWMRGSTLTAADRDGSTAAVSFAAESVRPLPPVDLWAELSSSGDLVLNWIRRSRAGFAWLDEVDAAIGESQEQYRVTLIGAIAQLDLASEVSTVTIAAADLAPLGAGTATVEVRQVGDWAASRPAQLTIELP